MANERYYCFWLGLSGQFKYDSFDELEPVLELVKDNARQYTDVKSLHVVWGELLEFEPEIVVETYKIKETKG